MRTEMCSASKGPVETVSILVDKIAKVITGFLEQDMATTRARQRFPGLIDHYNTFCGITGDDSTRSYADELAQAIVFHEMFRKTPAAEMSAVEPLFARIHDVIREVIGMPEISELMETLDLDQFSNDFHDRCLKFHDPGKKKKRGVFFTPDPVASFMVRSIDEILKQHFSLPDGISNNTVSIEDPACGTGIFLKHVYDQILGNVTRAAPQDIKLHLLRDIAGNDIMLSSTVFCQLQLGLVLSRAKIKLEASDAINVRHGNSLVKAPDDTTPGTSRVLVMLGNPPYAVSSANKSAFIEDLMKDYKDGLHERNIQPLSDDYIKFIRYAQYRVQQHGKGIVALVTNNAYVYKMIYRGMRENLLSTFDKIYVINFHGNSNIGEKAPDGSADDSLFDIRVGTCIAFFIKTGKERARDIDYHEIYGERRAKLDFLEKHTVSTTAFTRIEPAPPNYFFIKKDTVHEIEYNQHTSLKDIFKYYTIGIKTHRDDFIVELSREALDHKMHDLVGPATDVEIKEKYQLNESQSTIKLYRGKLKAEGIRQECFMPYHYRVFDNRTIYYSPHIITRHRLRVMKHMLYENVALVTTRLLSTNDFCHCFVTSIIGDIGILSSRTSESAYFFPLYLHDDHGNKQQNVREDFTSQLQGRYPGKSITPEVVLGYVYAILHSPGYRQRYAEYLKIDFPRIPFAKDYSTFTKLANIGTKLMAVHLLKNRRPSANARGDIKVEKIQYDPEREKVNLNGKDSINGISPATWAFKIGNYPVLHKWLRGRKGTVLSANDTSDFLAIANAIDETLDIMVLLKDEPAFQVWEGL